jgi:hypothetical protein
MCYCPKEYLLRNPEFDSLQAVTNRALNLSNITYNTTDEPDTMDLNINGTIATAFRDFPLNTTSALLLGE